MPKKIPLEDIKKLLPKFINIIDSTYRGKRYQAEFIDLDYNENFKGLVDAVIYLQHGCRSRANDKRRTTLQTKFKGKHPRDRRRPISEIKEALPSFIKIDENTYRGIRHEATFFDEEYNTSFKSIVANVLRGKGYCPERKKHEFRKSVTLSAQEIQKRIKETSNGLLTLIESSYVDTKTVCKWMKTSGEIFIALPTYMLSGRHGIRKLLDRWKAEVFVRDKWICKRCQSSTRICAHHIKSFKDHPDERLNISNGATLCNQCHVQYHALFKDNESVENYETWLKTKNSNIIPHPDGK